MKVAEFEERSYEAPLYNQLERGTADVFTPGQVLENRVGFDRGIFLAEAALWETLGYTAPLRGAALAYYLWPLEWGPTQPRTGLPRFRLNLFLQAKRPTHFARKPRALKSHSGIEAPLWMFNVNAHQQRLLEVLADKTRGKAHVAYASAAFHTSLDLFTHTKRRTIVERSTFPSVDALRGHTAWYYQHPGASGTANPELNDIRELPLLERIRTLGLESTSDTARDLVWLDVLASQVVAAAEMADRAVDATTSQFFDDIQTLERLAESYQLRPTLTAYAKVRLFVIRFDLTWLLLADAG
jgi:hypothetical protein